MPLWVVEIEDRSARTGRRLRWRPRLGFIDTTRAGVIAKSEYAFLDLNDGRHRISKYDRSSRTRHPTGKEM